MELAAAVLIVWHPVSHEVYLLRPASAANINTHIFDIQLSVLAFGGPRARDHRAYDI